MVCLKILFVSSLDPIMERVVMTAKAMVGTAMNWKRRVKTVAMKLEELVEEGNVHPAENGTKDEGSIQSAS